jgi:hypothetical protein
LQRPHRWPLSQYVAQRVKILLTKQQGQKQRETEMARSGRFRRRPTNGRRTARTRSQRICEDEDIAGDRPV